MKQSSKNIPTVERLLENNSAFDFNRINMLSGTVVSITGRNLPENISMLLQCCGNLGATIEREVSKNSDIIIVSNLNSVSDDNVKNASKTTALFTTEEISEYVAKRLEMFPDESTAFYFNNYKA